MVFLLDRRGEEVRNAKEPDWALEDGVALDWRPGDLTADRQSGGDLPPTKKPPRRAALQMRDIRACGGQGGRGPGVRKGRAAGCGYSVEEAT